MLRLAALGAYGGLFGGLMLSRFLALDQGFWLDEAYSIRHYAQGGPSAIFFGDYIPNNHMLFNLCAWAVSSMGATSEVAMRLCAAAPFIAGVVVLTVWAHRRFGATAGLTLLFFFTVAPLLIDLSRQARGYGLAFLAAAVMVVAAHSSLAVGRPRRVAFVMVAGVAGSWVLPIFGVAWIGTVAALALDVRIRRAVVLGAALSALAICVWYLPVATDLMRSSGQHYGRPLPWHGVISGPAVDLLEPLFGFVSPVLLPVLVVLSLFGIARLRRSGEGLFALVLVAPILTTFAVLAATGMYVMPRFVSFLAAPLVVLIAIGCADVVESAMSHARIRLPVAAVATAAFLLLGEQGALYTSNLVRRPYEAARDAARLAEQRPPLAPVIVQTARPWPFRYYMQSGTRYVGVTEARTLICGSLTHGAVFVYYPYLARPAGTGCLRSRGAELHRLWQRGRNGYMDVWLIPPD